MKFEKIDLDETNRMIRFGIGQNVGIWYVRLDLWFVGFRVRQKRSWE